MNKKLIFSLVLALLIVGIVSAQTTVTTETTIETTETTTVTSTGSSVISSNPQVANPGFVSSFSSVEGRFGEFDFNNIQEICQERQDFIIQIAPGGCSPNVVRSDLLAEQNVPVFCQLQAIQINPTINVENIRNIRLTPVEGYPEGVSGVGFYRSRAALHPKKTKEGFPYIDNIGYAVILLKNQPNENLQPEEIVGKLTAKIDYDVPEGFGLGVVNRPIPVLSDEEWQNEYKEYAFMDGEGFVRVEDINENNVRVGIYADVDRKLSTFTVEKNKNSGDQYLPGFYCNAAYSVGYLGSAKPETKVGLYLDHDYYEVYKGEPVGDNLCKISQIRENGFGGGDVDIYCNGKRFTLSLENKPATLEIDGIENSHSVGSLLYSLEDGTNVYLAGMGIKFSEVGEGNSGIADEGQFIILANGKEFDFKLRNKVKSNIAKVQKGDENLGENFEVIFVNEEERFLTRDILFKEVQNVVDVETNNNEFEQYFRDAINFYKDIEENYDSTVNLSYDFPTIRDESEYVGQVALERAFDLAQTYNKGSTALEIATLLEERYPGSSVSREALAQSRLLDKSDSSYVFSLDGVTHVISLSKIEEPNFEKNGVKLFVNGQPLELHKEDEYIIFPSSDGSDIILDSYDINDIRVIGHCVIDGKKTTERETISLGEKRSVCGESIHVAQINIESLARISLNPINKNVGSVVEFSYGIGIEQRAIKLSPEKSLERIARLNEDIEKWNNVNENLGNVVEGMKAACFATTAALQVKNLFTNLGGEAIARQHVMENKWNNFCADYSNKGYSSVDDCYLENSDQIESDVNSIKKILEEQQESLQSNDARYESDSGGIFGGKTFDYDSAYESYYGKVSNNQDYGNIEARDGSGNSLFVKDVLTGDGKKYLSYNELREIELNMKIISSDASEDLKEISRKELYNSLSVVDELRKDEEARQELSAGFGVNGIVASAQDVDMISFNENAVVGSYDGNVVDSEGWNGIPGGDPIKAIVYKGESYILHLKQSGNSYYIAEIYDSVGNVIDAPEDSDQSHAYYVIHNRYREFKKFEAASYNNLYKNPELKYYETEPYKGLPALVPFDTNKGWYAATKQILPAFGNIKAFQDSGRVNSFWVCNVGENGREEFNSGIGDDVCQQINLNTGQPLNQFPGLSDSESRRLIETAIRSLEQAANAYRAGLSHVTINGKRIPVGLPAANIPEVQCQNFMSPKECQLMFNVCDPVICPSSRCDLGGKFHVDNVVQTGIIGSALMCLPNANEGIFVPVCLTGIHAGIDNYVSILEASRDCLQEAVDNGRYVGICDEVTAIYECQFFWNQVAPLTNTILPKLLEFGTGQQTRGGGEYLNVQSAWQNMQNSIDHFKNFYGVNALKSFQSRTSSDISGGVCEGFISTTYPTDFETLIEPDSPVQFSAWFDEIPMTDATVNPQSQYKVFFHIFAGNDQGVQYSIYLKNQPGSSFFTATDRIVVETGFVPRGEYADEARDIIAPSGFQELCIRTNFQEECGFKQVSTSFAVNYVRDAYVKSQVENKNIETERECVSGTSLQQGGSALALLNPNIQSGVEETIQPSIYERGIIRICSTDDPGLGNDEARWIRVGNCGDMQVGCWLDSSSINQSITDGHEITIEGLDKAAQNPLGVEIIDESKLETLYEDFEKFCKENSLDKAITESRILESKIDVFEKDNFLLDNQESKVDYLKARIKEKITRLIWLKEVEPVKKDPKKVNSDGLTQEEKEDDPETGEEELEPTEFENIDVDVPVFEISPAQLDPIELGQDIIETIEQPVLNPLEPEQDQIPRNPIIDLQERFERVGKSQCSQYAKDIYELSNARGVNYLLISAIMIQESNCDPSANGAGSLGLMQINAISGSVGNNCGKYGLPSNQGECSNTLLTNTRKNIDVGIIIFKEKQSFFGYNGEWNSCTLKTECGNHPFGTDSKGRLVDCQNSFCMYAYDCDSTKFYSRDSAALRAYNGWSCSGGDELYVERVTKWYLDLVDF